MKNLEANNKSITDGKKRMHPDNWDWSFIREREPEVKPENERFGLPFNMSDDLKAHVSKKLKIPNMEKIKSK